MQLTDDRSNSIAMNENIDTNQHPFSSPGQQAPQNIDKKRKMWRNLFLLNLCLSLLLIGIFWLPAKLIQMEDFWNSPSVNLPQKGEAVKPNNPPIAQKPANLLDTQYVTVNASSEKDWTYFDFSRGSVVKIHDPTSLEWDLAFRRGKVISNGGATNKIGKAGLIDLKSGKFEEIAEVPTEPYIPDIATKTETENPVLLKWYKYNYLTHKLTAKKNVYAVRTADNKYAKVQFLSFYCDNKETGCIKMRFSYQQDGSPRFVKTGGAFNSPSLASNPPETAGF